LESDDPTSSSWLQAESCASETGSELLAKTVPLPKVEAVTLVLTVQPGNGCFLYLIFNIDYLTAVSQLFYYKNIAVVDLIVLSYVTFAHNNSSSSNCIAVFVTFAKGHYE